MPATMRKVFEQLFDFSKVSPLMEQKMVLDQMLVPMLLMQMLRQAEMSYQQMAQVMAEESEKAVREERASRTETRTPEQKTRLETGQVTEFSLLYYNPELRKVETVEEKLTIKSDSYSGPEQQAVEEAAGQKSMYGPYSLISSPIMMERVNPYILESVLSRIEVENPKPFGGGAAVHIPAQAFARLEQRLQSEGREDEMVALDALRDLQANRDLLVRAAGKQIIVMEEAIKALQETDRKQDRIIQKLPPLSRMRYLALLRKKKSIERTLIADLLIADVEFLDAMRKKLKRMGLREFLEIMKKLRKATS
ncbi:MAG: hypothetical protein AB1657_01275 [Candidatus Micrarchaeota archaeon]